MTAPTTLPSVDSSMSFASSTSVTSLRPDRRTIRAGVVGALALSSGVALTATSGWLIVRASERPQILTLLVAIVAVRAFGMARPVLRYAERLMSHDDALGHLASVRTRAYAALIPLTPARLGRRSRAELLSGVVDDLTDVAEARARVAVPLIASAGTGVLAALGVALLDLRVAAAVTVFVGAAVALTWLAWRLERAGQDSVLQARAATSQIAELIARQGDSLAAIGASAEALTWVDRAHDTLARAVTRQARGRALLTGALLLLGASTAAGAAWLAAGRHDGPTMALLVVVPIALIEAFAGTTDAVRGLARAQAAASRVASLLDQAPAISTPAPAAEEDDAGPMDTEGRWGGRGSRGSRDGCGAGEEVSSDSLSICFTSGSNTLAGRRVPPTLHLVGVTAHWSEATAPPALRHTDLILEPGSRTVLVGENGSGKSTLLAVLARHLDPSTGRYLIDGVDARTLEVESVRGLVAVLDDEPHIFAATLADNLRLARPDASDDDLLGALRRVQLTEWFGGLSDGLSTRLGDGGLGVSGGERARLGLARVLLSGRPIVLLDEPVAHLDRATADAVVADVFATTSDRTVVMVSHHPEALPGAHRILDLSPDAPAGGPR